MKKICIFAPFLFLFLTSCQSTHKPNPPPTQNQNCIGKLVNEKREGLWTCTDPSKQKIELSYSAGLRNGRMKIYTSTGQLITESDWKNGVLDGELLTYFDTGKTELYSQMKNGKIHGVNKEWDKDSRLLSECFYNSGVREGRCLTWYANGKKESSAFYKNNLLDGPYDDWYESGVKRSEALYKNGKAIKEKYWTADGQPTQEAFEPYF